MSKKKYKGSLSSEDEILKLERKIKMLKDQIEVRDERIIEQRVIIQTLTEENSRLSSNVERNLNGELIGLIEKCCLEAKKNYILFCEGSRESLDYKIYSTIYPTGMVIPMGGCVEVMEILEFYRARSKSFYAIIDGDKRGRKTKSALRQEGVFCLEAQAVENLMFTDEIFIKIISLLNIDNPNEHLQRLKDVAIANYSGVEKDYNCRPNKENILLIYPPKKILGLAIQVIQNNKLAGYFECFLNNLNDPEIMSILEKYTPSILIMEKEKSLCD